MAMSNGIDITILSSARLVANPVYYPANVGKNGSKVSQKVQFTVMSNRRQRGGAERKSTYDIVGWGKLADTLAQTLHAGKELFLVLRPSTYEKRHFNRDFTPRLDSAGQQMVSRGTNFTIIEWAYGDDSARHISEEIAKGPHVRPPFWNVPWHADFQAYRDILKTQKDRWIAWDGRSPKFGNADVRIPQGMQVDFSEYTAVGGAGGAQPNPYPQNAGMPDPGQYNPQQANQQQPNVNVGGVDPQQMAAILAAMQSTGMSFPGGGNQQPTQQPTPPANPGVRGADF